MDDDLAGVDELYDLDPEEFVAERDRLAARLRSEGDRGSAAAVRKLRRPTVTAWALNQVARRHREEVEALVDAGRAAADAQERALAGEATDLRAALATRSDALHRVAGLVGRLLDERGSSGDRAEVLDALTAASSDPDVGATLLEARLDRPPSPAPALGSLEAMLGASIPERPPKAARSTAPAVAPADRVREEEERARELERARTAAEREVASARTAATRHGERLEKAQQRLRDARDEVARAASALEERREEYEAAARDLEAAEEQLRSLG